MSNQKQTTQKQRMARNRRVQRMKQFIIACAVLLLISSVVLNLVLVIKVMHLQDQINKLYSSVQVEYSLDI